VLVVAAAAPGQSATAQSAPLAIRPRPVPLSVSAPTVTGTAKRGRTLTAGAGAWSNDPTRFGFQWLRCDGGDCREIAGATGDGYVLTKADVGFAVTVVVTASNAFGSGSATAAPTGPVAAAPPVNTRVPVITGTIQQGATLTVGDFAWDATPDTAYSLAWLRCGAGGCAPIVGATGAQYMLVAADVGHTLVAVSTATNVDGSASARSAETAVVTVAGPRWKTLPLISNSPGRVGDTVTMTPGTWSGPVVNSRTTELMRCTNVCVPRGAAGTAYTIADSDLGAILRVRETASNAGGSTTVWSARYVGPVVSAQAAAAVLTSGTTRLRNAKGSTLALAKLSAARASAAKAKRAKVTLRRSPKVGGELVAWACPATISAGATPPPCSAKVTLRKAATLSLPPSTTGKVRVVVVRSGSRASRR
jgi:hypothetical protein